MLSLLESVPGASLVGQADGILLDLGVSSMQVSVKTVALMQVLRHALALVSHVQLRLCVCLVVA